MTDAQFDIDENIKDNYMSETPFSKLINKKRKFCFRQIRIREKDWIIRQ